MSTIGLRLRLERLLDLAENLQGSDVRGRVAYILDLCPKNLKELNKEILIQNRPNIKSLMGRTPMARKSKLLDELFKYKNGGDLFGQICDVMNSLVESGSGED